MPNDLSYLNLHLSSALMTAYYGLRINEKTNVSWANNLGFEAKFSGKSFMYIRKSSSPRIDS